MRYHAKERPKQTGGTEWVFEERECPLAPTSMLLVRIMIGKVENKSKLTGILQETPVKNGTEGWNCVFWVMEALEKLEADGKALGTSVTAWESVRDSAMTYCQSKKDQHRFDGKGSFDMSKVLIYDLIKRKEIVP